MPQMQRNIGRCGERFVRSVCTKQTFSQMEDLPPEIIVCVCNFLDVRDVVQLSCASRRLHSMLAREVRRHWCVQCWRVALVQHSDAAHFLVGPAAQYGFDAHSMWRDMLVAAAAHKASFLVVWRWCASHGHTLDERTANRIAKATAQCTTLSAARDIVTVVHEARAPSLPSWVPWPLRFVERVCRCDNTLLLNEIMTQRACGAWNFDTQYCCHVPESWLRAALRARARGVFTLLQPHINPSEHSFDALRESACESAWLHALQNLGQPRHIATLITCLCKSTAPCADRLECMRWLVQQATTVPAWYMLMAPCSSDMTEDMLRCLVEHRPYDLRLHVAIVEALLRNEHMSAECILSRLHVILGHMDAVTTRSPTLDKHHWLTPASNGSFDCRALNFFQEYKKCMMCAALIYVEAPHATPAVMSRLLRYVDTRSLRDHVLSCKFLDLHVHKRANADMVMFLTSKLGLQAAHLKRGVFTRAYVHNQTDLVKWLCARFKFTWQDLQPVYCFVDHSADMLQFRARSDVRPNWAGWFKNAAKFGNMPAVQWLCEQNKIERATVLEVMHRVAIDEYCAMHGGDTESYVHVVTYIWERFNIEPEDGSGRYTNARANFIVALLRAACLRGDITFLERHSGVLRMCPPHARYTAALASAAHGHVGVMQWLIANLDVQLEHFVTAMKAEWIAEDMVSGLQMACQNQHVEAVRFLSTLPSTLCDSALQENCNVALQYALQKRHPDMVFCLLHTFKLSESEIQTAVERTRGHWGERMGWQMLASLRIICDFLGLTSTQSLPGWLHEWKFMRGNDALRARDLFY